MWQVQQICCDEVYCFDLTAGITACLNLWSRKSLMTGKDTLKI